MTPFKHFYNFVTIWLHCVIFNHAVGILVNIYNNKPVFIKID